jgi:hypothetical protein
MVGKRTTPCGHQPIPVDVGRGGFSFTDDIILGASVPDKAFDACLLPRKARYDIAHCPRIRECDSSYSSAKIILSRADPTGTVKRL